MVEPTGAIPKHDLGYEFFSPSGSDIPLPFLGKFILRPTPTNKHFDPEKVYFVISDHGNIEHLTITFSGIQQNNYQVVAGPIRIQDRKGKVVFAFTFGGELHIREEEGFKECTLSSPAPILQFLKPRVIRFVEEVEITLAERRAEWGNNPIEFDRRLSFADPLMLYKAFLEHLIRRINHPSQNNMVDLKHYLQTELQFLHKKHSLPLNSPPLKDLI